MAKQEEIREGIINLPRMEEDGCDYEYCKKYKDNCPECRADTILQYLHSQGVVLKVDRELPEFARLLPLDRYEEFNNAYVKGQEFERDTEFKAGYVAVESLIKESTNGEN